MAEVRSVPAVAGAAAAPAAFEVPSLRTAREGVLLLSREVRVEPMTALGKKFDLLYLLFVLGSSPLIILRCTGAI
jgi:hypothetical protein